MTPPLPLSIQWLHPFLLVYRLKMCGCSCDCGAYWSDLPLQVNSHVGNFHQVNLPIPGFLLLWKQFKPSGHCADTLYFSQHSWNQFVTRSTRHPKWLLSPQTFTTHKEIDLFECGYCIHWKARKAQFIETRTWRKRFPIQCIQVPKEDESLDHNEWFNSISFLLTQLLS